MDLKTLIHELSAAKQLQPFADRVCNGSVNYLYQVANNHGRFSPEKARLAVDVAAEFGYSLPLHSLRPDIWRAA